MKFIHLSDLHLGARLDKMDLHEDQQHILQAIVDAVRDEKPEALVIAGDVYDKADPPADAIGLFNRFITALSGAVPDMHIMVISGNHDSGDRLDLYRDILTRQNIHVAGTLPRSAEERIPKVTLKDAHGPVHFYLLPYVRPGAARRALGDPEGSLSYEDAVSGLIEQEQVNPDERNVLITHQFYVPVGKSADDMTSQRTESELPPMIGNVDAVSASVLEPFVYAACGHLHRPMNIGNNARYCGTPLQYSKSEADQGKSITVVELDEPRGEAHVSQIPLEPLRPVHKVRGTFEELTNDAAEECTDLTYVTLVNEDLPEPHIIISELRKKYPNIVRYDVLRSDEWDMPDELPIPVVQQKSTLEVCLEFLQRDTTEEEEELLQEIIGGIEHETD